MKRIATLDAETDPFLRGRIPAPFLWGLFDGENYYEFTETEKLICFLSDKDWRVYAHNGGKFDFHFLLGHIPSMEKLILINGRLVQFKIGDCTFQDSWPILPSSLKSLTAKTAIKKREISYDIFEASERIKPENAKLISEYLEDDCRSLHEIICRFLDEHGYSMTIASAAIKKLQKIEGEKIENTGKDFYDAMKPYYFGGRVECFKKGIINKKMTYLDINSAYPYAMIHNHPWGKFIPRNQSKPKIVEQHFYFLEAESHGAFPYRTKDGLEFPADKKRRKFYVTGWELKAAKDLGLLKNPVHIEQIECSKVKSFKDYVTHFYEIRKRTEKGTPENIFAKLFLNSAYGKFAANPEKYRTTYIADADQLNECLEDGMTLHGEFSNRFIVSEKNDDEQRYYNVAVGASITGFVRAYLLRAIKSVKNPIYCDTDSLVYTGSCSLKLGVEIGQWKIEGEYNKGGVGGKKLYVFENGNEKETKIASKGARLTAAQIYKICQGEIVEYEDIAPVFSVKNGIKFTKKRLRMT